MKSNLKYLVPNGITFLSLTCGIVAIMLAVTGNLQTAGMLVLTSYILDLFDGAAARYLRAGSAFGLQLDSLVDMVSLGAAPATIAFAHAQNLSLSPVLAWPIIVAFPLAGAFRLARFNLLPAKESGRGDSVGLTISTGGATLALTVLADLSPEFLIFPNQGDNWFLLLILITSLLMVSTIPFPSFMWVFSNRWKNLVLIVLFSISLTITSFFPAWFFWNKTYLGISLARAGYKSLR